MLLRKWVKTIQWIGNMSKHSAWKLEMHANCSDERRSGPTGVGVAHLT